MEKRLSVKQKALHHVHNATTESQELQNHNALAKNRQGTNIHPSHI
jgi:hypothetical protein